MITTQDTQQHTNTHTRVAPQQHRVESTEAQWARKQECSAVQSAPPHIAIPCADLQQSHCCDRAVLTSCTHRMDNKGGQAGITATAPCRRQACRAECTDTGHGSSTTSSKHTAADPMLELRPAVRRLRAMRVRQQHNKLRGNRNIAVFVPPRNKQSRNSSNLTTGKPRKATREHGNQGEALWETTHHPVWSPCAAKGGHTTTQDQWSAGRVKHQPGNVRPMDTSSAAAHLHAQICSKEWKMQTMHQPAVTSVFQAVQHLSSSWQI